MSRILVTFCFPLWRRVHKTLRIKSDGLHEYMSSVCFIQSPKVVYSYVCICYTQSVLLPNAWNGQPTCTMHEMAKWLALFMHWAKKILPIACNGQVSCMENYFPVSMNRASFFLPNSCNGQDFVCPMHEMGKLFGHFMHCARDLPMLWSELFQRHSIIIWFQ